MVTLLHFVKKRTLLLGNQLMKLKYRMYENVIKEIRLANFSRLVWPTQR